jgi:hypothetical protein
MLPPLAPPEQVAARLSLLLEASVRAAEWDLQTCSSSLLLLAVTLLRAQEEVRQEFLGGVQGQVLLQLLLGIVQASEINQPGSVTYDMMTYGVYGAASAAALSQGLQHIGVEELAASMQHTQVTGATAVAMLVTWCFMSLTPAARAEAATGNSSSSSSKTDVNGSRSSSSSGTGSSHNSAGSSSSSSSSSSGQAGGVHGERHLLATAYGCVLTEPVSGEFKKPRSICI